MLKLPTRGMPGRPQSARRHHEWLATWLQGRRRGRLVVATPVPPASPLEVGLLQFYQPLAGATRLQSWGESESPPGDVVAGLVSPLETAAAGPYASGDYLWFHLHPYRVVGGGRIYGGMGLEQVVVVEGDTAAVNWPAWTVTPGWATGFIIVRWLNWDAYAYRDVPLATMVAGWTDDGTGWSADGALPGGISNPPTVAKVMWSRLGDGRPEAMPTVLSPLGGVAFDSSYGHRLARSWSADLRSGLERTMAYWVCPAADTSGVLSSLRGIFTGAFGGNYNCSAPTFSVGDGGEVSVEDHLDGDWYLVVLRSDPLDDLYKVDLVRLRDEAQFSGTSALVSAALSGADDYLTEGVVATLVLGSSWHWNLPGYGFYDRLGMWSRALLDDEILDLFNSGLGWSPGV